MRTSNTALAKLKRSPYPAYTSLKVRIWQLRWYKNPKSRRGLINDLKKQLVIVFRETEFPDQRFIWEIARSASVCNAAEMRSFISAVENAKEIDPWLKSMFIGKLKYSIAWRVRGDGFANEVSEKAWKTFYDLLDEAQVEFENAMRIQPDFPEAATVAAFFHHLRWQFKSRRS